MLEQDCKIGFWSSESQIHDKVSSMIIVIAPNFVYKLSSMFIFIAPKETIPKETVPKEGVPKETVPKEGVPKETVPKEGVPKETVPSETSQIPSSSK